MKKKLVIALIFATVFCMTACGEDDSDSSSRDKKESSSKSRKALDEDEEDEDEDDEDYNLDEEDFDDSSSDIVVTGCWINEVEPVIFYSYEFFDDGTWNYSSEGGEGESGTYEVTGDGDLILYSYGGDNSHEWQIADSDLLITSDGDRMIPYDPNEGYPYAGNYDYDPDYDDSDDADYSDVQYAWAYTDLDSKNYLILDFDLTWYLTMEDGKSVAANGYYDYEDGVVTLHFTGGSQDDIYLYYDDSDYSLTDEDGDKMHVLCALENFE